MSDDRWSRTGFREEQALFHGATQNARVWTEGWVREQMFCPNCGAISIKPLRNNSPAADFLCEGCGEDFELKSARRPFGRRIVDGALKTMMDKALSGRAPNLLLLNYDRAALAVTNLIVVPKQFVLPAIIEARKPLGPTARRAGWQGCNLLVSEIPDAGKVWLVRDGTMREQIAAREDWQRVLFLRGASLSGRGWLIDVMRCVEEIGRSEFDLADVYAFEARLRALYPDNGNVRPKIRQQLQVLRDKGFLSFMGGGRYRLGRAQ